MTSESLFTLVALRNHCHQIGLQLLSPGLLVIELAKHVFGSISMRNVKPINLSGLRYDFGVKFVPHFFA